jgi:GTP cyclohydrolase I
MMREIAMALNKSLKPQGVAVQIEASHLCMMMRGVQKENSKTITSKMLGTFRDDPKTRNEFLSLLNR